MRFARNKVSEEHTEVLIVGGGVGGCAAALAAARANRRVVLTEETDWIGGQFTAQAVPPDEHGWIERFGCTQLYRSFREKVRDYYRAHYPLTSSARASQYLNPGNGWVSPLCHEPRVALAVLEAMLAPYVSRGDVRILLEHEAIGVELGTQDRVRAVVLMNKRDGDPVTISADYFLDATELGDLLPLAGMEFVTGAEAQIETGEPSASTEARPYNIQAYSMCFALDYEPGADHTIEQPRDYDFWRAFVPQLTPPWAGSLLSWNITHPRTMRPHAYRFDPLHEDGRAFSGLWTYRRLLDRANFAPGFFTSDISLMNVPMLDYLLGDLCSAVTIEERRQHIEGAKQQSLSFLYWMQTAAPRPDGGEGWAGLRLRSDVTGTRDGLAKAPYIREARRARTEFTVCEQHVAAALNPGATRAVGFPDSIGVGYYRIDLHPSTGGDNYLDVAALPFQIPLGALIPVRMENLLPAAKNIGTTHITNGCYRLHPVEWNIGEATGSLVAFCLARNLSPRECYNNLRRRREFQQYLIEQGVQLEWPSDLNLDEGDPHVHAQ